MWTLGHLRKSISAILLKVFSFLFTLLHWRSNLNLPKVALSKEKLHLNILYFIEVTISGLWVVHLCIRVMLVITKDTLQKLWGFSFLVDNNPSNSLIFITNSIKYFLWQCNLGFCSFISVLFVGICFVCLTLCVFCISVARLEG